MLKRPVTIWHAHALDHVQRGFRPLLRVSLPLLDVALITFSLVAFIIGSPAVRGATVPGSNLIWAAVLLLSSTSALFGLVFQWSRVERYSKVALATGLIFYVIILVISPTPTATPLSTLLSAALTVGVLAIIGWRLYHLALEGPT